MGFRSFITSCDSVCEENKLYNNGGGTQQTMIGGILTIFVIFLIIFTTWTLGNDIFYKTKPNILIQNQFSTKRPEINLNSYTFPISICVQNSKIMKYFTILIMLSTNQLE
jgi:hypothetical protein